VFRRDYNFLATDFAGGSSNREAIDGFSAIAAALDQGVEATGANGSKIADAVAISLGWLVLAAVIFYPALQLAAILTCAAFMCVRSFTSYVLGSVGSSQDYSIRVLRGDEQSLIAANRSVMCYSNRQCHHPSEILAM
jgi:hypothetical protein